MQKKRWVPLASVEVFAINPILLTFNGKIDFKFGISFWKACEVVGQMIRAIQLKLFEFDLVAATPNYRATRAHSYVAVT